MPFAKKTRGQDGFITSGKDTVSNYKFSFCVLATMGKVSSLVPSSCAGEL